MRKLHRIGALLAAAALGCSPAWAQDPQKDKDKDQDDGSIIEEVIVTGSFLRARQGGAQDINHFRGEAEALRIPMPDTLTPEGLFGGYDLVIGKDAKCAKLFCLTAEAMKASLPLRPNDKVLVGVGFATDIDAATWRRAPVNLVAVVDKSGSMDGQPLALVRDSLHRLVRQMKEGDQFSIVLYGDRSYRHLEPIAMNRANVARIHRAIDQIRSNGSTNMEEGLQVGYETAFATAAAFKGVTRLMLFTDEQPNVGNTDAGSFMGMAEAGAARNIGLTTIGVGVQFDAPLATKVSSVHGGNLFFLRDEADAKSVFEDKLDVLVSALAYDLTVSVKPHPGYRVSGVFGVPGEMLGRQDEGVVTFTVPTIFLSKEGGGLFVALEKAPSETFLPDPQLRAGEPYADLSLSYVAAANGARAQDRLSVVEISGRPSEGLRLGHTLIDEFLALREGASLFHEKSDEEGAYQTFRALASRLDSNPDPRLKPERQMLKPLVEQTAFLSGHQGEVSARFRSLILLQGEWEVVGVFDDQPDLKRGDRVTIDEEELTVRRGRDQVQASGYKATRSRLQLESENDEGRVERTLLDYTLDRRGEILSLVNQESGGQARLRRVSASADPR